MKKIKDLTFGFSDAVNYNRRENKTLFNNLFVRNIALDKLIEPTTSFLVGDKGTGKTAYAVWMVNNEYYNTSCSLRYIRETDYEKFITLKKEKHLQLSDFVSIWKVIIYLLLSDEIDTKESNNTGFLKTKKYQGLRNAINEYYYHAFSPEIKYALQFIQESKIAAQLLSKFAKFSEELKDNFSFTEARFQTNLLYIQKKFENAIKSLKLRKNYLLFIDGIDIRPTGIPYDEYLACIKGLANAIWEVNNDFFPSIRDSQGRLRVVLLIRPDIFSSLGLQNLNTKIRDNSVLLNWYTTYADHRDSDLFSLSDRLLAHDQPDRLRLRLGDAWDHYFPYDTPNVRSYFKRPSSFIGFLRFALYRPRDIVTMLILLRERHIAKNEESTRPFIEKDFSDSQFRRNYANYLLGEVKDQLSFYYSAEDYEMFLKFFEFLNGKNRFTYSEYKKAFVRHFDFMSNANIKQPQFMDTQEEFLQFLYELNVISFLERTNGNEPIIHWCFIDRSLANIAPKVKLGKEYEIFYGMSKAINTGRKLYE